mmetsp:Transcript_38777/g.119665  ORF Transcript_38777/g.119665 Transcript_38777/m.119665 type:complete len:245 (+) Transcript_38777:67-801(+)
MEVASLAMVAGAVSMCLARDMKKRTKAQLNPTNLVDVIASGHIGPFSTVRVLVVRVLGASLPPKFAGSRCKVRVELARQGSLARCDTPSAQAALPERPAAALFAASGAKRPAAAAELGAACLFLAPEDGLAAVGFRAMKCGLAARTVGKSNWYAMDSEQMAPGCGARELPLYLSQAGGRGHPMGHVTVSIEVHSLWKCELCRFLRYFNNEQRHGGIVMQFTPLAVGSPEDEEQSDEPLVHGVVQ